MSYREKISTKSNNAEMIRRRRDLVMRDEEEMAEKKKNIQPKLEISQPGDVHEQQADLVASKVSNGQDASSVLKQQHTSVPSMQTRSEGESLQGTENLQRKLDSSKGSGQSLPGHVQQDIGGKMGADLSDVKIHTGSNAHEMSEGINAKAFTHGQDIYFKNGNYNPSTPEGKNLLAHELTHTVQQNENSNGSATAPKIQKQFDPNKKKKSSTTAASNVTKQQKTSADSLKNAKLDKNKTQQPSLKGKTGVTGKNVARAKAVNKKAINKTLVPAKDAFKKKQTAVAGTGVKKPVAKKLAVQPKKNTSGLTLSASVSKELGKLKAEASRVKNAITASGNNSLTSLQASANAIKSAIDADAGQQSKSAELFFDKAILDLSLAYDTSYLQILRGKSQSIAQTRKDADEYLKQLDVGTLKRQLLALRTGGNYALEAEKNRDNLNTEVNTRTYNQIFSILSTRSEMIKTYKNSERKDRINTEMKDMASQANEKLLEAQQELSKKINSDSNDLAKKFRGEAIELSGKVPDGKDGVASEIKSFRDDAISEMDDVSLDPMDQMKSNINDLVAQLKREKQQTVSQILSIAKQGKDSVDLQMTDARTKINAYVTDAGTGIDSIQSEIETEIPAYPDKTALAFIHKGIEFIKKAETQDKKNMPLNLATVLGAFTTIKEKTSTSLLATRNDVVAPVNETVATIQQKAKEISDKTTASYKDSISKAKSGMKDSSDKFFKGIDDTILKSAVEWQKELDEGKKELREKVDEVMKKADETTADTVKEMRDEAKQLDEEYEATYWLRVTGSILWGFVKALAGVVWFIVKWVVIIVVAIIVVIAVIIILILLLPEDIGALLAVVLDLIIDAIIWVVEFIVEDVIPFLAKRAVVWILRIAGALLGAWGVYQLYQAYSRKDLSIRQRGDLGGEGLLNVVFSVFSEWKLISGLFKGSQAVEEITKITALCGGDANLAKLLMNATEDTTQLERLLAKASGVELQQFLLKAKNLTEVEKGLNLVKGDTALLQQLLAKSENMAEATAMLERVGNPQLLASLLSKTENMAQVDRLLTKVGGNPTELERLLNEAGSGSNLEEVLNKLPEGTSIEGKTYEMLKAEAEAELTAGQKLAKEKGYPDAEEGYYWVKAKNGKLVYRRKSGAGGNQRYYDETEGIFKDKEIKTVTPRNLKKRPEWSQSEKDVGKMYPGYKAQRTFKGGEVCPPKTKGCSKPDFYKDGHSIEVKNYDLSTSSGRSSLKSIIKDQFEERLVNLPAGSKQTIVIDVRGQKIADEILFELETSIKSKTSEDLEIIFMTNTK